MNDVRVDQTSLPSGVDQVSEGHRLGGDLHGVQRIVQRVIIGQAAVAGIERMDVFDLEPNAHFVAQGIRQLRDTIAAIGRGCGERLPGDGPPESGIEIDPALTGKVGLDPPMVTGLRQELGTVERVRDSCFRGDVAGELGGVGEHAGDEAPGIGRR